MEDSSVVVAVVVDTGFWVCGVIFGFRHRNNQKVMIPARNKRKKNTQAAAITWKA